LLGIAYAIGAALTYQTWLTSVMLKNITGARAGRPGRLERARQVRRVRVRPRGRGLLALGDLGAQLGCPLGVQGGAQPGPHHGLLQLDMLPRSR
jgi:hypothetical protein